MKQALFLLPRLHLSIQEEKSLNDRPLLQRSFSLSLANCDLSWEKINRIHNGPKSIFAFEYSNLLSSQYRMQGWLSDGYSTKNGSSSIAHYSTPYHYTPFGIGVKHTVPLTEKINLNIGAGALVSMLRIRSNSPLIEQVVIRWDCGTIIKTQLEYTLATDFFIGLFADCVYQQFRMKYNPEQSGNQVIDFNGAHYGIPFGWRW